MNYLTEERRRIRDEAREFAMTEVLPVANELDRKEADIPWELIAKMGEKRYFGITVPTSYDGLGLGVFEYCLITEELSRAWMSSASVIARAQGMGVNMLPPDKREEYLRKQVRGEFVGAFALSEAEAGSDVANVQCRAERVGDEWVINGEKKWVGWAKAADFIVLFARTQPMDSKQRWAGITSFLILKERDSFPDRITGEKIEKIGYFGITTWTLSFTDFRIPVPTWTEERASSRSRGEGMGFLGAVTGLNTARVHTAARAVGAAQGAFDEAMEYAQQRKQFGRPIAHFQAIRFKLAEMATEIEAARQLWYSAAQRMDNGEAVPHEASMAKLFASEMSERVTSEAIQVLGGEGYTRNHAVERHWRDARLTKIFEGTSEIQKRIISDALLGQDGTMKVSDLTGTDNSFEDFTVGDVYRHARGKTVTEMDGVLLTHLVMNTAQGHFNEHLMASSPFGGRIVFGGVVAAIVIGLAYEDTGEQALAEVGLDAVRFKAPVHHGDTLYAYSEVLALTDSDRDDAGLATFRHTGINQNDDVVFEGERRVLLKRRSHWGDR